MYYSLNLEYSLSCINFGIVRVKLSKDQDHGAAWGRLVWNGRPQPKIEKIGSTLKKQWRLVSTPNYLLFPKKLPIEKDDIYKETKV